MTRTIKQLIKDAGGPAAVAEAGNARAIRGHKDLNLNQIYKWHKFGMPYLYWSLIIDLIRERAIARREEIKGLKAGEEKPARIKEASLAEIHAACLAALAEKAAA
jgi:hypothetical protein